MLGLSGHRGYTFGMPDFTLAFHLTPPDVHADRCLNARHRQAGCTWCVDHCPTDALSLMVGMQPLPVLDEDVCVGCGACMRGCPTDAFSQARHPETKLINLRDEMPAGGALVLACPQHPAPERSAAPADYAIRHQRCLAAFSPEQLLSLSQDGGREVWLADDACDACPIGPLHDEIAGVADAANQLLMGFGLAPTIHLTTQRTETPLREVPVLDGAAPAVSRRGFFRSLGKLTQQRASEMAERAPMPLFAPDAPVDQRLPYQTPPSLRRLNQHLADLAQKATPDPGFILNANALPWASVRVAAQSCSGCQLCARFCPTGALNYLWGEVDDGLVFNLTFQPALCLDCNICVAVCPEDAVTVESAVALGGLLRPERSLLMAGYLEPCQRCGTLTSPRPQDEQTLCYVCRPPTMYRQRTQRAYLAGLARQLLDDGSPQTDN